RARSTALHGPKVAALLMTRLQRERFGDQDRSPDSTLATVGDAHKADGRECYISVTRFACCFALALRTRERKRKQRLEFPAAWRTARCGDGNRIESRAFCTPRSATGRGRAAPRGSPPAA